MFRRRDSIKKEELLERFRTLPNRKISDAEKQLIFIFIEKSKIQRERSMAFLNKGFLIFFAFVIIAYLSRVNELISPLIINILFVFGILVLVVAIVLYQGAVKEEEKNLDDILESFLR